MSKIIESVKAFWKKLFSKKDQSKIQFIGSRVIQPGHKVYEYNYVTETLQEAKVEKSKLGTRKAVIMNERCLYVSALNKKNAAKKLNKKQYNVKF